MVSIVETAVGGEAVVWVRGFMGSLLLATAVLAGCSSNTKGSAPVVSAGAGSSDGSAPSGVVAAGSAKENVPADLAFVVVGLSGNQNSGIGPIISGSNGFPIPGPTESPKAKNPDHNAIRAALASLGLAADAVEFSPTSGGLDNGGSVLQVEVPVARLPKIAHDAVDAIGKAGATISGQGLRLAVRDCATAITSARTKALANARANAEALADAGDVSLGPLVAVSEAPASSSALAYFTGGRNPCGRDEVPDPSGVTSHLASLDAPARVDLTESVSATFALAGASGGTVDATGEGEITGPADSADIIVAPENSLVFDGSGSTTPKIIDSAAVVRAVRQFGIDEKDVEIEDPPNISVDGSFSQSAYIRVHVSIPQLTKSGHQIVAAIRSAVGNASDNGPGGDASGTVGVLFTASDCHDLQKRARAAAAADARRRIDKLAAAAHLHAGAVTGLADSNGLPYLPLIDPCELDVDDLSNVGLLTGGSSYPGLPQLADLDAEAVVTEQVSLRMGRQIGS